MSTKKISELPSGSAGANAIVPATNAAGTTTQKVTLGSIAALGGGPPAAHKTSHATGGTDALSAADIGAAASSHSHAISDVTGLQTALDGKQASGSYAASSHSHAISDVTGLQTALDGKQASGSYAAASHSHEIADVTGLQTALDGKQAAGSYAAASHNQAWSTITSTPTTLGGYGITDAVGSSDSRLTDSRTPTAHKTSHATGGSDALSAADIGAASATHAHSASDITSGTIDAARLGSGTASSSTYLRGDGQWATPSGGSGNPTVVALSYSSTLATDASAGSIFDVTLTGNVTLSNPTNPTNGQTLRWRVKQDATGGRTVTLGNKFALPASVTTLEFSTAANKLDILAATYHSGRDKWDVVALVTGY